MSHVRMCDQCYRIFAEAAEGSGEGTLNKWVKDEHGRKVRTSTHADFCPSCYGGTGEERVYPAAIESTAREADEPTTGGLRSNTPMIQQ